jgi:hypothetical protein
VPPELFDRARSEFHEPITAGCARGRCRRTISRSHIPGSPSPVRHGLGGHDHQHSTTSVDCLRASASTEVTQ